MEQPANRSKWVIPMVALVSFVIGVASGVGVNAAARFGSTMLAIRELLQDKNQKARADITEIKEALDSYAMYNEGNYPATLTPLVTPDHRPANHFVQPTALAIAC